MSKNFFANQAGAGVVIVDAANVEDCQSLVIGFASDGSDSTASSADSVVLQVDLYADMGVYTRRFALPRWRQVELSCSAYRSVSVRCLAATASHRIAVNLCARPANPARQEPVIYPQILTASGEYPVPPGAKTLYAGTADSGFEWRSDAVGGSIAFIEAVTVAGSFSVKGTNFFTTAAPFNAVWAIEL